MQVRNVLFTSPFERNVTTFILSSHSWSFVYCIWKEEIMSALFSAVDFSKQTLWISLASIAFNPTAWNIVARNGMCHWFVERFELPSVRGIRIQKQNYYPHLWWEHKIRMLLPSLVYLFRWNPSRHTVSHHFVPVISNLVTATPFHVYPYCWILSTLSLQFV